MKILLKTSVGVLALMMGTGLALAQTSGSTSAGIGSAPMSFTCDQLAGLDEQQAEQRVYFLAGYQAAQEAGSGMGDTQAGITSDAPETTAGAELGTDMDTQTTAGATDMETDTGVTAEADTGASEEAGTDTTTTAATSGGSADSMSGFSDISIQTVMSECENNPDMLVLDILRQQGGAQ